MKRNMLKFLLIGVTTLVSGTMVAVPTALFYSSANQKYEFIATEKNVNYDDVAYVTFNFVDIPRFATDLVISSETMKYMQEIIPEHDAIFKNRPMEWAIQTDHKFKTVYIDASNIEWEENFFSIGHWFLNNVEHISVDISKNSSLAPKLKIYQDEYGNSLPVFRTPLLPLTDKCSIDIIFPDKLETIEVGKPSKEWKHEKNFISEIKFKNITNNPKHSELITQINLIKNGFDFGDKLIVE